MRYYVNGYSARCKHCIYYSETVVPQERLNSPYIYPGQEPDGYCSRIFPRGYTNAGKEGGYVWGGQFACWLIELKDEYKKDEDPETKHITCPKCGQIFIDSGLKGQKVCGHCGAVIREAAND